MITLAAVALTCWVCSLIALPRKPLLNNEVQELVYARLLGRQHLVMLLALIVTAWALLMLVAVARPSHIDPDFNTVRRTNTSCIPTAYDPACTRLPPDIRVVREIQDDGKPAIVTTIAVPHK